MKIFQNMKIEEIEVGNLYFVLFKTNYVAKNINYNVGDVKIALVLKITASEIQCLIEKNIISMMYNEFLEKINLYEYNS